MRSDAPEKVI
jgi:clathrin heavy chain